jgi:hypothetical protein
VTLAAVNATQVKLLAADFGAASWVRVVATANGGGVSDSITITSNRDARPITHRGKHRSDVTYAANDAVTHKGSSFLSKHDANLGNTPVDSEEEDTHWSLLARRGDAGDPASAPALFTTTIALTNTSGMVNLRKLAKTAGYTGKGDANITFNVPNGVLITGRNDGGIGIDTGLWPDLEHTVTLVLNVNTGGIVRGGGGNGGSGKGKAQRGGGGGDGGDAINCRTPMTVNISAGGEVSGGGGGGDGGSSTITGWPSSTYSEAGGGGGGFPNGAGGHRLERRQWRRQRHRGRRRPRRQPGGRQRRRRSRGGVERRSGRICGQEERQHRHRQQLRHDERNGGVAAILVYQIRWGAGSWGSVNLRVK